MATEIVGQLLDDGHEVHGTVRSKTSSDSAKNLEALAKEIGNGKLVLHEADLLVDGSFDACVSGRDYVLHTASVFKLAVDDIKKDLIDPAIDGTFNVLKSVNRTASVKRTILTATYCTIWSFCDSEAWSCPKQQKPKNGEYFNEDDWATTLYPDGGLAYDGSQAYCRSKVEQDKAAREFADLNKLDLVTIHPSLVVGPPRGKRADGVSMAIMMGMAGGTLVHQVFPGCDLRDLAVAHIKAAIVPEAKGRYLVTNAHIPTDLEIWKCLKEAYPSMELGDEPKPTEPHWMRASSERTEKELLGRPLTPLCKTWADAVGAMIKGGHAVNTGVLKDEL